jgi:hypothetical protein
MFLVQVTSSQQCSFGSPTRKQHSIGKTEVSSVFSVYLRLQLVQNFRHLGSSQTSMRPAAQTVLAGADAAADRLLTFIVFRLERAKTSPGIIVPQESKARYFHGCLLDRPRRRLRSIEHHTYVGSKQAGTPIVGWRWHGSTLVRCVLVQRIASYFLEGYHCVRIAFNEFGFPGIALAYVSIKSNDQGCTCTLCTIITA